MEEVDAEYTEQLSKIPDDITQISNEIAKVESESKLKNKSSSNKISKKFQCDHCDYSTHRLANLKWSVNLYKQMF